MANTIVLGSVTLKSTFRCISVVQAFTGDDNSSASAAVDYSTDGSTWYSAQPMYVDHRATINGTANPVVNTAASSIVGLSENTSYQVRITWTDADGITGTNPVTTTISTQTRTPTTTVRTVNVANDAALTTALASHVAGDDIVLAAGTYSNRTISVSGTSGAWTRIRAATPGTVTIGSGTFNVGFTVSGSYLWFKDLTMAQPTLHSFQITGSHIQIQSCTLYTGTGANASTYYSCVSFESAALDVRLLSNTMKVVSTRTYANSGFVYYGIFMGSGSGSHIIDGNTCSGDFAGAMCRDGFGCDGGNINDGPGENTDICYNTITDCDDDCIETEGRDRNVRVYGNVCTHSDPSNDGQGSCHALAGPWCGPIYIFRNFYKTSKSVVGVKQGNEADGPAYIYHNTWDVTGASNGDISSNVGGTPYSENTHWRNNILKGSRYTIYRGGRSDTYDYNLHYTTNGTYINEWEPAGVSASYATLALFKAGTSQEAHGVSGNPTLNSDGTLTVGSPAIDIGVSLPNFNGTNSYWPNGGSGPDAGAYEYDAAPVSTPITVVIKTRLLMGGF